MSVVVATAVVAAACSSGAASTAGDGTVVIREEATAGERPAIPNQPSAEFLRAERAFVHAAPLFSLQQELGLAPAIIDPGTYTLDALGTPVTFTFDEHWRLDNEFAGYVGFTRPDAELDALLPALTIHRPIGFADPALVATDGSPGTSSWSPWDLQEWIDRVDQIVVLDQGELTIDGRRARWWDIDVDPSRGPTNGGCQPGSCVLFLWSGAHTFSVARDLERIRWYEIEDPQGPIVGFVSVADAEWEEFSAKAHELISSARFGPSAPHPIPERTAYAREQQIPSNQTWRFGGVEGVTITSPNFFWVSQRPGELRAGRSQGVIGGGGISLIVPARGPNGEPVATAADITALIEAGVDSPVGASRDEVFGVEATLLEFEHDGDPLLYVSEPRAGLDLLPARWPMWEINRAWVFESPIGPAMVTMSGSTYRDLEGMEGDVDWFFESLEFCEEAAESCDGER